MKVNQGKEAQAVRVLAGSVKAAGGLRPQTVQCKASMSTDALISAAGKAGSESGAYAAVGRDARAVLASWDAKVLDDAKAALDEAARLLSDSEGKMADNATRDGLQQAIDQAGQVKGDEAKAYQDAANALQAAIDQVNASVQVKSQADQQAASSNNNGQSGYTLSCRPSYGQGGGCSAPSPDQQPVPSTSNGRGYNPGVEDWMNSVGHSVCQQGQACGVG